MADSNNGTNGAKVNFPARRKVTDRILEEAYGKQNFMKVFWLVNLVPWLNNPALSEMGVAANRDKKYVYGLYAQVVEGILVEVHDYRVAFIEAFQALKNAPETLGDNTVRQAAVSKLLELMRGYGACYLAVGKDRGKIVLSVLDQPEATEADKTLKFELRGAHITLDHLFGPGVRLKVPGPLSSGDPLLGGVYAMDLRPRKEDEDKRSGAPKTPEGLFFLDFYTMDMAGKGEHSAQYNVSREDNASMAIVTITSSVAGLVPTMQIFNPESSAQRTKRKQAIAGAAGPTNS